MTNPEVKELKECTACGAQWLTSAEWADCLDADEIVPLVVVELPDMEDNDAQVDDDPTAGFTYRSDKFSDF